MNTNLNCLIALLVTALLAGCGSEAVSNRVEHRAPATATIAVEQDVPVPAPGTPLGAVLWVHPTDPVRSLVVGASGAAGVTLMTLDGQARGSFPGFVADAIALTYDFDTDSGPIPLLVVHDRGAAALRAFKVDPATLHLRQVTASPLRLETELT